MPPPFAFSARQLLHANSAAAPRDQPIRAPQAAFPTSRQPGRSARRASPSAGPARSAASASRGAQRSGNFIKMDRHKYVKLAFHGFQELPREDRLAKYGARPHLRLPVQANSPGSPQSVGVRLVVRWRKSHLAGPPADQKLCPARTAPACMRRHVTYFSAQQGVLAASRQASGGRASAPAFVCTMYGRRVAQAKSWRSTKSRTTP